MLLRQGSLKMKSNLRGFTSTNMFKKMVDKTFAQFDLDGGGSVDCTEVYCMVLFIYLKLNSFANHRTPPRKRSGTVVPTR